MSNGMFVIITYFDIILYSFFFSKKQIWINQNEVVKCHANRISLKKYCSNECSNKIWRTTSAAASPDFAAVLTVSCIVTFALTCLAHLTLQDKCWKPLQWHTHSPFLFDFTTSLTSEKTCRLYWSNTSYNTG